MLTTKDDFLTMYKVCLKGTKQALQHAYRRSIRMIAEFDNNFGADSQPEELEFRWETIDGYRVMTVMTDGVGIFDNFNDIEGISECLWVLYDDGSDLAMSNDETGKILDRRDLFDIPRVAKFELCSDGGPGSTAR
jgi:hypothetical protein